jgi:hypothetical protein
MPDGFRILENGDYRLTEADVFRITERFDEGFSDHSGTGSLAVIGLLKRKGFFDISSEGIFSATPTLKATGATNLSGTGSIAVIGGRKQIGLSNLNATGSITEVSRIVKIGLFDRSGTGSIAVIGTGKLKGFADLQLIGTHLFAGDRRIGHSHNFEAAGTVAADAIVKAYRSSDLTSTSSLAAIGLIRRFGLSALNATGTIASIGLRKLPGLYNQSGIGTLSSDSDVKAIVSANLSGTGTLAADGTRLGFNSTLYVKDTSWKVTTPYVKHLGSWKVPDLIYVKVSGAWTRVY